MNGAQRLEGDIIEVRFELGNPRRGKLDFRSGQ